MPESKHSFNGRSSLSCSKLHPTCRFPSIQSTYSSCYVIRLRRHYFDARHDLVAKSLCSHQVLEYRPGLWPEWVEIGNLENGRFNHDVVSVGTIQLECSSGASYDRSISHPQQGRIDFNTVNPSLPTGMDFLIHPCR